MTRQSQSCALAWAALIAMGPAATASVSLHNPSWEAPGGYAQVSAGISPAHFGGLTWNYSGFDATAYAALYYVIGDYDYDPGPPEVWTFNAAGPAIGTSINGLTRLDFDPAASNLTGGKVVWTNMISIYDASASINRAYRARFTLSVYDGSGDPVPLLSASGLVGMDDRLGGTHQILGDFAAHWYFELLDTSTSTWTPATPFFDSLQTDPADSLQSSVTRAFYYTPVRGDMDVDSDVDLADFAGFQNCFGATSPFAGGCVRADLDDSTEVDLADLAEFQAAMTGPIAP